MIAEVCFTCGRDASLAASTDRPRPGVRRIWVVDSCDAGIKAPAGVEVWVIPFNRGGNLQGWPCLDGMVSAYARAFAEGASAVIKRDSDTVVLDDATLTAFSGTIVAIGANQLRPGSQSWNMFGSCYSLSPAAMPHLVAGVTCRDWPTAAVHEDIVFSWFLRFNSQVHPWTAIRFTLNRHEEPGPKFAENRGNLWILNPAKHPGRARWMR